MIAPARAAAFQILLAVTSVDMHSDELLRSPQVDALAVQDRALATTLVMGTLRWQIRLDAQILALLARPDTKLTPPVETALRLGAYQLLYLDRIPAYAAIGESVELAKEAGETFAAGMVNAVLRKISKLPRPTVSTRFGNAARLAEAYAHPEWMVARWARAYGMNAATAICQFDQEPATVSVRLLDPEVEQSLADEGVEFAPGEFLSAVRRVVSGDIVRSAAFRSGRVRIQEEGSQLVAELAGSGSRILDTCAAPGGKTAILAERNSEATITAWDVSRKRLDAMRKQFVSGLASPSERLRFEVCDASAAKLQPEYDLILCDVPCTGTGTIGRNPEIRFRINESGIARQHERQVRILSASLAGLAPEGRLLYSTCSLEPEENEAVVAECLAANPGFELRPLEEEITQLSTRGIVLAEGAERLRTTAVVNGCLRTIPGVHGCDGFFAASLVRKS